MRFMGSVADVLTEAGHEVIELRPVLNPSLLGQKFSKTKKIHTIDVDPLVLSMNNRLINPGGIYPKLWEMEATPMGMIELFSYLGSMFAAQCDAVISNSTILRELRDEHFDIGINEGFDFCGFGLFEAIGVKKVVAASTTIMYDHQAQMLGVPTAPSYVPGGMSPSMDNMTFFERLANGLGTIIGSYAFAGCVDRTTAVFRKRFGADFPSMQELFSLSAIMITNSHPLVDFPHPLISKVVEIGGIGIKNEKKKLPSHWNSILNQKGQTVLISFGSVIQAKDMPVAMKTSILETARSMPDVQFIWKYEEDDILNAPENLILSKWTPQAELLKDSRLSLFVTHGGLASCYESSHSGTPMVIVPLFADQPRNAMMMRRHGAAAQFNKHELGNARKLSETIKNALKDNSYSTNARRLSSLLKSAPFSPKELLVKNVEFVGEFGRLPEMEPFGRKLSFIEYFMIDVIAFVSFILLFTLIVSTFVVYKLISMISCRLRPILKAKLH
ncbi:unnamed protein product, partial [Mesorhabditis belari]|uniref:glucuronosyltransferase n=1 Tax=Mesorhabditis belari TaxID=2138241 RepID=A0AAF3FN71_9BILA